MVRLYRALRRSGVAPAPAAAAAAAIRRLPCRHRDVEMQGPDGYCVGCGEIVGTYDHAGRDGAFLWFKPAVRP